MSDCVFCSIVADNSAADRLYEDERTLAFLDIEPATLGHTLIIPKEHHETVTTMQESLAGEVFQTARRVAVALESTYEAAGFNIVQSNGSAAGQEIFHAHVHVIPRYEDDSVTVRWSTKDVDTASQQEIVAALRDKLDSPPC